MKHRGCKVDFAEERTRELMRVFRDTIALREFIDIGEVSRAVVNTPCSRFWISEERALRVVNAIMKGFPILYGMRPSKREMFKEIYRRVTKMLRECPGMSVYRCVIKVVNSPAPKFYMTPGSAMTMIYKTRKEGKLSSAS